MPMSIDDLTKLGDSGNVFKPIQSGLEDLNKTIRSLGEVKAKKDEMALEQNQANQVADYLETEGAKGNIPNLPQQYAAPVAEVVRRMGKTSFGSIIGMVTRDGTPNSAEQMFMSGAMDYVDYQKSGNEDLLTSAQSKWTAALKAQTLYQQNKSFYQEYGQLQAKQKIGALGGGGKGGSIDPVKAKLVGPFGQIIKSEASAQQSLDAYKKLSPKDQAGTKGQKLLEMADGFAKQAEQQRKLFDAKNTFTDAQIERANKALKNGDVTDRNAALHDLFLSNEPGQ